MRGMRGGNARTQASDLYLLDRRKRRVPLLRWESVAPPGALLGSVPASLPRSLRVFFRREERPARSLDGPPPVAFLEISSGLVRVVHREIVIRFRSTTPERQRRSLLRVHGFKALRVSPFVPDQWIVHAPARSHPGEALLEIANLWAEEDGVVFAAPNFLSVPRRETRTIQPEEWHLCNAGEGGAKSGEDLRILPAWERTTGRREIVVAVLDDGVDLAHPNLRRNLWRNPDAKAPDRRGRDFFLPDDHPGHFDPRPKRFLFPFDQVAANDIHGTPCAGLIAAAGMGGGSVGVAPGCRILPVKIFHADGMVADERVANAIRWAGRHADVLSCSWSSGVSPDVELALEDIGVRTAVFCAAGNGFGAPVSFPARSPDAIAVGASTDRGERAGSSSCGPELAFLAPSSGGTRGLFTTDVSQPGLGFAPGLLHTHRFGGTSAAAALAAGVGALVLSVHPELDRTELKALLAGTCDRIKGGWRLNAARAVEEAAQLAPKR